MCTTVPGACAAVMSEVGSCCRELVEMCWSRKVVPETLDTRKRMERLLQVFTSLDENGKRCVRGCVGGCVYRIPFPLAASTDCKYVCTHSLVQSPNFYSNNCSGRIAPSDTGVSRPLASFDKMV